MLHAVRHAFDLQRLSWPGLSWLPQDATLRRSLVLALLLHVWLVLMFGTHTGGTARPGEGVWGALNVRLQALVPGAPGLVTSQAPTEPAAAVAEQGPRGRAKTPRSGGVVREVDVPPPQDEGPGAARLGAWQAISGAAPIERVDLSPIRPAADELAGAPEAPDLPAPPVLQADPASPPARPTVSRLSTLQPVNAAALQTDVPSGLPQAPALSNIKSMASPGTRVERIEMRPQARISPPSRTLDTPLRAPAPPRPSAPAVSRLAPSLAPLSGSLPEAPSLPAPRLSKEVESATAEALANSTPKSTPPSPTQPVLPQAPPAASLSSHQNSTASATPAMPAAPAVEPASAVSPAVTPATPASTTTSAQTTTQAPAQAEAPPVVPSGAASNPTRASDQRVQLNGAGAPDAGLKLGHDVATPPSVPPERPRLNLDLPRSMRTGEMAARERQGVLNLVPPPPERKSKLTEGMEKSVKKDCRTAYGGGILAVVPLAINALRDDKNCKW